PLLRKVTPKDGAIVTVTRASRKPSPLKASAKNLDGDGTVLLGAARPNAQFYSWQAMSITATKEAAPGLDGPMTCVRGETPFDLCSALNYGLTIGPPELIDFFSSHVKAIHNPPYKDWETCLSCGSTAAIDIALRMFCNRGDWVLTEQFTYTGTMIAAEKQGLKLLSIRMDDRGLDPADLDLKLSNWDTAQRGQKPFVLYTIPSGQNPTGTTQPTERKRAIYQLVEKHDIFIEDDPYYLFALDADINAAQDGYRLALPTSYLSLDTSGRVLRLDSTSKILAPGLRSGWVTGCSRIDLYVAFADVSTLSPSGPSQVMLVKLLRETWGQDGFLNWKTAVYRPWCLWEVCSKEYMFVWIRVDVGQHPGWSKLPLQEEVRRKFCQDVEGRIHEAAEERGVVTAKGSWFGVEPPADELFFRLSYVTAPEEALDQAVEKFGQTIAFEFAL
ncbi:Aromatic amino acid aminotransferase, partial [Tolypocladium capitatum]